MIFKETILKGVFIIEPEPRVDERGFFARYWCKEEFDIHGLNSNVVQCNISYNKKKATLRGMHYQEPNYETKLVRCTKGSIYDVVIDLRKESDTYKKWIGLELTEKNGKALYVPEKFAHGYQTLEDDTFVFYQVTEYYAPASEKGIRWNDPQFQIIWPYKEDIIISQKDQNWELHNGG